MRLSKFSLYNAGWLELVFINRNKEYGAYELRQHYGRNMTRAMMIAITTVAALTIGGNLIMKSKTSGKADEGLLVTLHPYVPPTPPAAIPKKMLPSKPMTNAPQVHSTKFLPPVVTNDPVMDEPPQIKNLTGAVGNTDIKGDGSKGDVNAAPATGQGVAGTALEPDNTIHLTDDIQVMPEPVGGAAAWAKFLQKNLRFPATAQDQGVSGKVWLSFVIEKDGSLSNIVVERPAGYGFDEEAMRVLKLAPAWKPGIQNNIKVRVKYTIPINFQFSE